MVGAVWFNRKTSEQFKRSGLLCFLLLNVLGLEDSLVIKGAGCSFRVPHFDTFTDFTAHNCK